VKISHVVGGGFLKRLAALLTLIVSTILVSCVSLQSVSLTQVPAAREKVVSAEASKFLFLGIAFDNDFVDDVTRDLKAKCPDGKISGILTKDEAVNYFLFIFTRRRVSATGYCLQGEGV